MKKRIAIFLIALFVTTMFTSNLYARRRGLLGGLFKKPKPRPRPKPASTNLTPEQEQAKGTLNRFLKQPQRVEIHDEVAFGDTVTAKIINSYNRPLLPIEKYRDVWDYCNLIVHALSEINVLRPRLKHDSDYEPPITAQTPKEDVTLLKNVGWHVGIIDSPEVGGCSAPGGYILITTGLLKACRNESELAGVIAHEMAHISRSHGLYVIYQGMKKQKNKKAFLGFLSQAASQKEGAGAQLLAGLFKNAAQSIDIYATFDYGRPQEFEADKIGAQFMYRLGYDPYGLVTFINRLSLKDNKAYSSHPRGSDRVKRLLQYIRQSCPDARSGRVNRERYAQRVLNRLP